MARAGPGTLLYRRNIRLDSFLKRNTECALYERIRAYEPCVVKSDSINKVYMHVVLSDERVYLTEFPPRTLTCAFAFSSVRAIELINDLPEFLSAKDREQCQHIKVVYVPEKLPSTKSEDDPLFPALPSSHSFSSLSGYAAQSPPNPHPPRQTRSASCPNGESLGLLVPHPPARPHSSASMYPLTFSQRPKSTSPKVPRRIGSLFSRRLKQKKEANVAELHFYAISQSSTLYFHLQSSWTSFIIKSTLMLDATYRRKYCVSAGRFTQGVSSEQTASLFSQLQTEVLREGLSVERRYLLLQELRTAAHRNTTLRRLFWKSSDLCLSLVQTLEACAPGGHRTVYTTDDLLMSSLVVQTLAVMFRETEVEPARRNLLSANNGALAARMLLALVRDPGESQADVSLSEYLDAACSLLFELLLQGQEFLCGFQKSKFSISDNILSVGWILQTLQPHPHLLSFIGYQAQQVVQVLSSPHPVLLSPVQSVLLFKRCRLLLASLQHSKHLTHHLSSSYRDDFKFSVNVVNVQRKLPPHFPISPLIRRLVEQILTFILH